MHSLERAMDGAAREEARVQYSAEAFTLLGVALLVTALRTYYRLRLVGIKRLQADDYFVLVGVVCFTLGICLAYTAHAVTRGLANNYMTDEHRARLSPTSQEYRDRVIGAKIQAAGWIVYISSIWSFKAAMCTFFLRLAAPLWKYRKRILASIVFVAVGWVVVLLTFFLSCRPFNHMWQIHPNPGRHCQPAISIAVLVTCFVFNIATDLYLISIPVPIILESNMKLRIKIGLIFLFGCAFFIIIAASVRVATVFSNAERGVTLSGPWAVRETFVAVVVTNLPVIFPLFKQWLGPIFKSSQPSPISLGTAVNYTS